MQDACRYFVNKLAFMSFEKRLMTLLILTTVNNVSIQFMLYCEIKIESLCL